MYTELYHDWVDNQGNKQTEKHADMILQLAEERGMKTMNVAEYAHILKEESIKELSK